MLGRLFGRSKQSTVSEPVIDVVRSFTDTGVDFDVQGVPATEWLAMPYLYQAHAQLGALLAQLFEEGYATREADRVLLAWQDIYRLLDDAAYQGGLGLLALPPMAAMRPVLVSKGSLTDSDFSIVVSGWVDDSGAPLALVPRLTGAIASVGGKPVLLDQAAWRLLRKVAAFHQRPVDERTPEDNRRWWGDIRKDAQITHAALSDFLQKTIVLTPDKLHLELRKAGEGEAKTIEVTPTFADAPARWVEMFDRMPSVPERYEIPDGQELVHVVVAPEVRTVLNEIKRMPGRRVAGSRAEVFVRNPFALLGQEAAAVIDADDFEQTREAANLGFERFTPAVRRGADDRISQVLLLVEGSAGDSVRSEEHVFDSPEGLSRFVQKLANRLENGAQCCFWEGYDLEILGDTPGHLEQLRQALDEWLAPERLSMAEVYDLSRYSDRVEGIGAEKDFYSPFIARKTDDEGWFPDNVLFGFEFKPKSGSEAVTVPMDASRVDELASLVEDAKTSGRAEINIPGCPEPLSVLEAEKLVKTFLDALSDVKKGEFKPESGEKAKPPVRMHLVVKANIDTLDYNEQRVDQLSHSAETPPDMPQSLKPDVLLMDHQKVGLSWLQHLWRLSPAFCRGCVLADDMGLGKTIQLLSFIAFCLEKNRDIEPILVVAPVALLENWKEEIDKFFVPNSMPVLTLYGDTLKGKRLPKLQLDQELAKQGITRLLKRDWLGDAKVVLTTYETLRDLEFALAAQHWSIMICDEAQKIKNPNAMVTRAAKKQNVQFRIACTGTPVENTLTDLWCLFDFVQPGLLGSLSQFGRRYRKPIEAETEEEKERVEELRGIVKPQMLRREKRDVARDLPKKLVEQGCRSLPISPKQRSLYGQALSKFRSTSSGNGSAHLGLLQFLRRLCSDPMVEDQYEADRASVAEILEHSPKMSWLLQALKGIQSKNEKVIVFCEFRDLQRTLQRCIASTFGMHVDIINGDTSAAADHAASRQKRIRAFQERPGFGAIVLSPLAVGFGVNIQAANHVVHFTRTWNPAKEDQATDRAYRIGQVRDVVVYYPVIVAEDFVTFDQKLDQLLDWKRGLSSDMLNGTGEISVADFLDLQDVGGDKVLV
jgi:hypothetical protein